jgi:hypothetical protein
MKWGLGAVGAIMLLLPAVAKAEPVPRAMAVLGDSMSEAMLAAYSLESKSDKSKAIDLLWKGQSSRSDLRLWLRKYFAKPSLSWATGADREDHVSSHYERLRRLRPDLIATNYAVSGSDSEELVQQVDELLFNESRRSVHYDYITLLMGANDLGNEDNALITSPEAFVQNLERELKRLLDRTSDRRVLIVGLPRIHEAFEATEKEWVLKFWGWGLQCGDVRRGIYGRRTILTPQNKSAYEETKVLLQKYRDGLEKLTAQLQEAYPQASVKFIRELMIPENARKALSIDCFHPSEWGQAQIADQTWAHGFWPNLD